MFGGLRFSVWRIWGSEVLGLEDFEVLKAFGRTPSCSTSLPGGNQVDGLPPGVHSLFFTLKTQTHGGILSYDQNTELSK